LLCINRSITSRLREGFFSPFLGAFQSVFGILCPGLDTLCSKYKKNGEKLEGVHLQCNGVVGEEHTPALLGGAEGNGFVQPEEEAQGS